jgi:hypothetical protein
LVPGSSPGGPTNFNYVKNLLSQMLKREFVGGVMLCRAL